MSDKTGIEWTDATWNPVRGCSRVSPGCQNCYAERVAARFSGGPSLDMERQIRRDAGPFHGFATQSPPRWTGKVALVEDHLLDPLRWRKPRRIFVNSMSDLFHEALSDFDIDRVFDVMEQDGRCEETADGGWRWVPHHTFQILTKRADRMLAYTRGWLARRKKYADDFKKCPTPEMRDSPAARNARLRSESLPPWIWLGVSCEDQQRADERIPLLLRTPAAVRFLSLEPLLGPIELSGALPDWDCPGDTPERIPGVDWVIVGGESGPGARETGLGWIRDVVYQCREAGVPVFVKQVGSRVASGGSMPDRPKDRKGGNPDEWPEDLRVREFPR